MNSLENLSAKIDKYNIKKNMKKTKEKSSLASVVAIEIFSGVLVGGIFGYILDYYLKTKPIFIIICIIFGILGAFLNIYKIMLKIKK